MEVQIECDCGGNVSLQTPGANPEISESVRCDDCGADYAITITSLGSNEDEQFVADLFEIEAPVECDSNGGVERPP